MIIAAGVMTFVYLRIHKHEAVFLDGYQLNFFDFSRSLRFGNAFLLEVVLMRWARRASSVVAAMLVPGGVEVVSDADRWGADAAL